MKKQQLKYLSAYDRKTTYDIFFMTIEWLEKYIEIADYYSDWNNRKQIKNNNIKRKDIIGNPEKAERDFSTQLFLFKAALDDDPSFLREEVKEQFYRWISATEINFNNCPERLKNVLFGINEILEGRGEKIQKDIENRRREIDPNSPEYMEQMKKVFAHIQAPMQGERETKKSLMGKNHKDIEIGNKFGNANIEKGQDAFNGIAGTVSNHNNFHFFPQKDQLSKSNGDDYTNDENPQQARRNLIENITKNVKDWKVEKIITSKGSFGRVKEETMLVHRENKKNMID